MRDLPILVSTTIPTGKQKTQKKPVRVWSPKFSLVGRSWYLDGWPHGNTSCCRRLLYHRRDQYFLLTTNTRNWCRGKLISPKSVPWNAVIYVFRFGFQYGNTSTATFNNLSNFSWDMIYFVSKFLCFQILLNTIIKF